MHGIYCTPTGTPKAWHQKMGTLLAIGFAGAAAAVLYANVRVWHDKASLSPTPYNQLADATLEKIVDSDSPPQTASSIRAEELWNKNGAVIMVVRRAG